MSTNREQKGFVLVIVLWVLALLTVVTLAFTRRAIMDNRIAAYSIDRTQALYMARGAAQRGIIEIRNKAAIDRLQGKEGYTSFDQRWANPPDMIHDEQYYSLGSDDEVNDEECYYVIEDAERYISVNRAPSDLLSNIPTLSLRAATKILRERDDSDKEKRSQTFLTKEEIRAIKGVTDDDWNGTDDEPGLRDLLTVWGDGRINVNTASPEVLNCIPDIEPGTIQSLEQYMSGKGGAGNNAGRYGNRNVNQNAGQAGSDEQARRPLTNFRGLDKGAHIDPGQLSILEKYCKVNSSFYKITGFATQRQGKIRAQVTAVIVILGDRTQLLSWRETTVGP